jgi:hypothetical protein
MKRRAFLVAILAVIGVGQAMLLAEEEKPGEAKPSSYAPAKDLESQLTAFIEQTDEALAEESEYGEEQQATVARNAATISALGLVIGMHDEESRLRPAASALIAAGDKLAEGVADYAAAKAALDEVKTLVESPPEATDQKLEWQPAGSLAEHMKQVPIVNNNLRLGVTGRRFDRTIDRNAGLAASLAVLAQVSMADTSYCSDPESEAEWKKICAKMRDASADVYRAVRMKDQAAATKGLDAIVVTCDECHHRFRD